MTVEQSMIFKPGERLPIAEVTDTVKQILEKTSDVKRHGAVMVVDKDGKLAGIVTDADLRRLLTKHGQAAFELEVSDIMTADCKKIRADALAAEATAIFHKYRIDELPVVDAANRPVGLIDVQDILTIKVVG
jgi:arabinose-5-phosphate isomerase